MLPHKLEKINFSLSVQYGLSITHSWICDGSFDFAGLEQ